MLLLARMRRRKNLKAIVEILRMSWLTNFVRPKIQSAKKIETPDNLWDKCPSCKQMVFHRDLQSNLFVCPACQYHWRIGFKLRLEKLFDQGQYQRKSLPKFEADRLNSAIKKNMPTVLRNIKPKVVKMMRWLLPKVRLVDIALLLPFLIFPLWVDQWGLP